MINHIGVSGGKDSTALLLWAVHESGYDIESLRVTFADTGNEHDITYEYVNYLSENVHPVEWLKPPLDFYQLVAKKKRFPSSRARFCTQDLKMKPCRAYIYRLMDEGHEVLLHTGIRASESAARAALPERELDTYYGVPVYRPLLRWSIDDVWAIHEKYGIKRNPLYAKGFRRVGCAPCIMCKKEEIRMIADQFPERIDMIRNAENSSKRDGGFSSFFAADKVTSLHRSRTWTDKNGKEYQICSIDDVVRWSRTSHGGQQYRLGFEEEEEPLACSVISGACE